jgi:hypothetical protein
MHQLALGILSWLEQAAVELLEVAVAVLEDLEQIQDLASPQGLVTPLL